MGDEVEDDDAEEDEGEDDCAEDEVEDDTVEDDNVEDDEKDDNVAEDEVEDDDVADGQVEDDDVEDDDVEEEEEDRSPDCDPQFVRACAVEIHMGKTHEPFHAEIGKKNAAPDVQCRFCAGLRKRHAFGHLRKAILCGNLQEKCRAPEIRRTFRASLRSRNSHGHVARETILCGNLLEKCRAPGTPHKFCASLPSRHAHGQNTRAILCTNFTGKTQRLKRYARLGSQNAQWTCEKSRFMREFSASDVRRAFCASLCSPNAHGHVGRAVFKPESTGKCRARDTSFVRARAVAMHMGKTQEHFWHKFTRKMLRLRFLYEPARPKCTWTCEKSRFTWEFRGENAVPQMLWRMFCASLRNRNAHGHVRRAILRGNLPQKMPRPRTATQVLREPAQSKCTWTKHKSHFRHKFAGKCRASDVMRACAVEMHMDKAQEPFYAKFYEENAGPHD